jgi:hypothetical protein
VRTRAISALPQREDIVSSAAYVRFVPILLQKSKIERYQKSRESGFLDASTAASPIRRFVVVFVRNNEVPHIATHETHQRPWKISFVTQKRLLQQYLPRPEVAGDCEPDGK